MKAMAVSLGVAGSIGLAAWALAAREDDRLRDAGKRLEIKRIEVAKTAAAAAEAAARGREEEAKRSGAEFMKWLPRFQMEGKPSEPAGDEKMLAPMYERLERLTVAEATFVMNEYLAGRGLKGFPGPLLFNLCMTKLATDDPMAAITFFGSFKKKWPTWVPLAEMGNQIIGDAVVAMAKDDPDKAVAWLREDGKKFNPQISEHTKRVMLFHVASDDPVKAFALVQEIKMMNWEQAFASIVRAAKTEDERKRMLGALRSYVATLPDEAARRSLSEKALGAFADRMPTDGVESVSRWMKSADLSKEETDAFAAGMAKKGEFAEPGPWIDWIGKTMSAGKADVQVREMVSEWTKSDYRSAGNWLVALKDGPVREMAVRAYAETAAKYDPVTAAQWAETLPAGKAREETVRRIHADWPEDMEGREAFGRKNGIE